MTPIESNIKDFLENGVSSQDMSYISEEESEVKVSESPNTYIFKYESSKKSRDFLLFITHFLISIATFSILFGIFREYFLENNKYTNSKNLCKNLPVKPQILSMGTSYLVSINKSYYIFVNKVDGTGEYDISLFGVTDKVIQFQNPTFLCVLYFGEKNNKYSKQIFNWSLEHIRKTDKEF